MNKSKILQIAQQCHMALKTAVSLDEVIGIIAQSPASHAGQLQQAYFATFGVDISRELVARYKMPILSTFFSEKSIAICEYAHDLIILKQFDQLQLLLVLLDESEIETLIEEYFDEYDNDLRRSDEVTEFSQLWLHQLRFDQPDIRMMCQQLNREIEERNETFFSAMIATFRKADLEHMLSFYQQMTQTKLDEVLEKKLDVMYAVAFNSVINKARAVAMALSTCVEHNWETLAFIITVLYRDMRPQIAEEMHLLDEESVQSMNGLKGDAGRTVAAMWNGI